MIDTPKHSYLFVFDTGVNVDVHIETCIPVRQALEVQGGNIILSSVYINEAFKQCYFLKYSTPCLKIRMIVELTSKEYFHNLEFFGSDNVFYDEPISFNLEKNKFIMP